jgi:hypothetical protein
MTVDLPTAALAAAEIFGPRSALYRACLDAVCFRGEQTEAAVFKALAGLSDDQRARFTRAVERKEARAAE